MSHVNEKLRLPESHVISNRIFIDDLTFEEERTKILHKVWQFVCHESEVAEVGHFRRVRVADKQLFVVRGDDGAIRAFHNVCRHRGAEVVRDESGTARSFTCFYHHWSYSLDGALRAVAKPSGYEAVGLDKTALSLIPVRCESLAGLVFVSLDDQAEPLVEFLGEIADEFQKPLGTVPLEVLHFHKAIVKTNWKLWQDNNSERYHSMLHANNRKMLPWVLNKTSPMKLRLFKNGHSGYWADGGAAEVAYDRGGLGGIARDPLPGMKENEMRVFNLFPDLMINIRSNVVRIDRMVPLEPGLTLVEWRGLGVKGDTPELREVRVKHHNMFWGPAGRNLAEDVIAVESQWSSMKSDAVAHSIIAREEDLNPTDDANLRAYYLEWRRRMGAGYGAV